MVKRKNAIIFYKGKSEDERRKVRRAKITEKRVSMKFELKEGENQWHKKKCA